MKYVLRYDPPAELDLELVRRLFPAHRERWAAFQADGSLLAIGPFADPAEGALAVFTTQEAAEAFATTDPFVEHGVVAGWRVLAWNEAILGDTGGAGDAAGTSGAAGTPTGGAG